MKIIKRLITFFKTAICNHPKEMIALSIIALVVIALGIQNQDYGLIGYDNYPIILTSRIESFSDFLGTFTEKLMDGRYHSDFYRPVLNFSFALDYAFWGLHPTGYLLTNVILLGGCAFFLFLLIRRLAGPGVWIAPWVSLFVFLLHPTLIEVVPAPPRRADMLFCLFVMISLIFQINPKALEKRRPSLLPAFFMLLAIASKENAFVAPAISFVAVLLYSPRPSWLKKLIHACVTVLPHAVVVAIMIAARVAVIGNMGGHMGGPVHPTAMQMVGTIPNTIKSVTLGLLFPQDVMMQSSAFKVILFLFAAAIAVTFAGRLFGRKSVSQTTPLAFYFPKAAAIAILWITIFSMTYITTGLFEIWYLFPPVIGWSMLLGVVVERLLWIARHSQPLIRVGAIVSVALAVIVLGWQASYSPLLYPYNEWSRATTVSKLFLSQLQDRIDHTENGQIIEAPPIPVWVKYDKNRPHVKGAAILGDRSVQAWVELTRPQRNVRVQLANKPITPPDDDEVLVLLRKQLPGY